MAIVSIEIPGRVSHQQERSRRTASTILRAARAMLEEKPFAEISVADVVQRSGTSVGGFYARFKNKETLLELMLVGVMEEAGAEFEQMAVTLDGLGAADVVRTWAATLERIYSAHRTVIREVMKTWPGGLPRGGRGEQGSLKLRDRARETFRNELLKRSDEITHADPQQAIGFALMMGTVTLREAVIGRATSSYGVSEQFPIAEQISNCIISYLDIAR